METNRIDKLNQQLSFWTRNRYNKIYECTYDITKHKEDGMTVRKQIEDILENSDMVKDYVMNYLGDNRLYVLLWTTAEPILVKEKAGVYRNTFEFIESDERVKGKFYAFNLKMKNIQPERLMHIMRRLTEELEDEDPLKYMSTKKRSKYHNNLREWKKKDEYMESKKQKRAKKHRKRAS